MESEQGPRSDHRGLRNAEDSRASRSRHSTEGRLQARSLAEAGEQEANYQAQSVHEHAANRVSARITPSLANGFAKKEPAEFELFGPQKAGGLHQVAKPDYSPTPGRFGSREQ